MSPSCRLSRELPLVGHTVARAHARVRLVEPLLGHVEPAVQKRVPTRAAVGGADGVLTIGDLAEMAAGLPCDANRARPLCRESAAVQHHRRIGLAQIRGAQCLKTPKARLVVPRPQTAARLQGANGHRIGAFALKDHGLGRLALQIRELAAHIERAPLAWLAAHEQILQKGVKLHEVFGPCFHIAFGHIARWSTATRRRLLTVVMALQRLIHSLSPKLCSRGS